MESTAALASWDSCRSAYFAWRRELAWTGKLALCVGMAALTGLAAQVRIPLGFTPVPVTGQVFAVLLAGVMLGGYYGGLSQIVYVAVGCAGVPWFTGWSAGLRLVTAGYLVGFIPAAFLVGWLAESRVSSRRFFPQVVVMMCAVGIIYLFGAVWYAVVMRAGLAATVVQSVLPFVPFDAAKALAAAALSTALLPKTRR